MKAETVIDEIDRLEARLLSAATGEEAAEAYREIRKLRRELAEAKRRGEFVPPDRFGDFRRGIAGE